MGCDLCGKATPRSRCRQCALRTSEEAVDVVDEYPECPECGGTTSGEGVLCYRCRGDDEQEIRTDGGADAVPPASNHKAGDRVESTVVELVPELAYVPDHEAEHYDAETTTLLEPSDLVTFSGICLLERATVVEIKSAMVVLASGRCGRYQLRRGQHEALLEESGLYLFAVCQPTPSRGVLALKVVPASLVDELVTSWIDGGEDCLEYAQIAWSRLFDEAEVGEEVLAE
jgi:hypothetical protein